MQEQDEDCTNLHSLCGEAALPGAGEYEHRVEDVHQAQRVQRQAVDELRLRSHGLRYHFDLISPITPLGLEKSGGYLKTVEKPGG